ncbi:hypothetical protein COO60DRAFT_973623 [Scenedesmus sp. NREL 46B-D3]|nr:hypothetical protein COO60DRAFT_973623 [Scenedesmus sp. NREL 46B-D3]
MAAYTSVIGEASWPRRSACRHQRSALVAQQQKTAGCRMLCCPLGNRSLAVHAGMPDRLLLSSQEEYSFSLTQLMVVLDKPIGLTLAPDPTTGHVYVQHIAAGMSAADSRLVLVGDRLLSCSAVFGDEMWHAQDLQRTRWAINNRPGKVKLVLERGTGRLPPWYFQGREGIATWEEYGNLSSLTQHGRCVPTAFRVAVMVIMLRLSLSPASDATLCRSYCCCSGCRCGVHGVGGLCCRHAPVIPAFWC